MSQSKEEDRSAEETKQALSPETKQGLAPDTQQGPAANTLHAPTSEKTSAPPPVNEGTIGVTMSSPNSSPAPSGSQKRSGGWQPTFVAEDAVAGRYRIVRFIAQGGMGEVYEAEDLVLHGSVALKTIRPDLAEDARAVERFKREIHLARKVTHQNICRIYDVDFHHGQTAGGDSQEVLFLTMELLPGQTLRERIEHAKRMTVSEALPLVEQIASGLDAAHGLGIIHRDFKSANVVLVPAADPRRGMRAVITDFGLARGTSKDGSLVSISDAGAVVGTPAYMAPEQVQGLDLTPAADIYALGIVLYEMMTGFRPFDGGSAISVAVRRLTQSPPSPRVHLPDIDERWETAILKCLEREPTARFASALDLVAALKGGAVATPAPPGPLASGSTPSVAPTAPSLASPSDPSRTGPLGGTTLPTLPPPPSSSLSTPYLLVAAGAIAALGVAYGLWGRGAGSPSVATSGTPAASGAAAATVTARHAVAVLGFRNASGQPDADWLSTAIGEILAADLAANGKLRVAWGDDVARTKRDLALIETETLGGDPLARLRKNLSADDFVLGSFSVVGGGETRLLRLDMRLQDALGKQPLVTGSATGTEAQLFDLVSRASAPIREKLGLGALSPAQSVEVEASLPAGYQAMRSYCEGLSKLRAMNAVAAREVLTKAVVANPKHAMPHAALATAWSRLGYEEKARDEARKAVAQVGTLPAQDRLLTEARLHEIEKDWAKAAESYRSLLGLFPDSLESGLRLADVLVLGGHTKESAVTIESLRKLPAPLSEDPAIDLAAARAFQDLGDLKQQQALADRAATKGAAQGARLLVARARLLESTALEALGEPAKASEAVDEARRLYEAVGDRGGLARALDRMATAAFSRGELDEARRLYQRSATINREIGDKRNMALVMLNLGNVLFTQGQTAEAQKLYDETLLTFREIGAKYDTGVALNNLAARLQVAGDLKGAEKRYQEALGIFGEIGDRSGVAFQLTNLAEVLFLRGELRQAQQMHEESLATNREIGDKAGAAYDLYRLGEVFTAKGDLRAAQGKYQEAINIQNPLGDKVSAAQTQLGLAALAVLQGNAGEGEKLAREAEEALRSGGAEDLEAMAQAVLADALLAAGKLAEAQKASDTAAGLVAKSEDRGLRFTAVIVAARVRAASGKPEDVTAALQALDKTLAEARRTGFVRYQYETRLAAGLIEAGAGRPAGKTHLQALAAEATAKGFGLIAKRAEKT